MRRYGPACTHLAAPAPAPTKMRALLESRKATLEAMIRERFRAARENGTTPNVTMLSAALRALKRQTASLDRWAGSATHEGPA